MNQGEDPRRALNARAPPWTPSLGLRAERVVSGCPRPLSSPGRHGGDILWWARRALPGTARMKPALPGAAL